MFLKRCISCVCYIVGFYIICFFFQYDNFSLIIGIFSSLHLLCSWDFSKPVFCFPFLLSFELINFYNGPIFSF